MTHRGYGAVLAALGFFTALALAVFARVVGGDCVLFSTDDNIAELAMRARGLPAGWLGWWADNQLVGVGGAVNVTLSYAAMMLAPIAAYNNWIHAVDLVLAALFLYLFLRARGVGLWAGVLGGVCFAWLGTNLTLTYAGHLGKYGVLACASAVLWAIENSMRRRSVAWGILAGGMLGLAFLEQQDLALFFAMALGAYSVFQAVQTEPQAWWRPLLRLVPMGVIVILIAGAGTLRLYAATAGAQSSNGEPEEGQAKWEFCTQWSVPPDETIDLIAPNYFGIRSGEPAGPYWGRTGRSAGWEATRQGFMNFRLESIYVGAIPVLAALFAVAWALAGRGGAVASSPQGMGNAPARRAEILFWGAVVLITLLLAYGKYFPLYALFYKLPVVNNIRNPNKFLQVFQMALGILAAYGLDAAVRLPTAWWRKSEAGR